MKKRLIALFIVVILSVLILIGLTLWYIKGILYENYDIILSCISCVMFLIAGIGFSYIAVLLHKMMVSTSFAEEFECIEQKILSEKFKNATKYN